MGADPQNMVKVVEAKSIKGEVSFKDLYCGKMYGGRTARVVGPELEAIVRAAMV